MEGMYACIIIMLLWFNVNTIIIYAQIIYYNFLIIVSTNLSCYVCIDATHLHVPTFSARLFPGFTFMERKIDEKWRNM